MMAYEHLYQGRRRAAPAQAAASPQPNGVSFVEHMRRLHPPNIDASAGLNESERRQVKEWRRLLAANLVGVGTIIPAHLLAAVYDGCAPQSAPSLLEASSDPTARIARQITAGMSMSSPLATDRDHPRTLATDQPGRPRNDIAPDHAEVSRRADWSHHLQLIIGQHESMDEDVFRSEMERLGITSTSEKMGLLTEATHFRLLRARGAPPKLPARYIPAPHVNDPKNQHFIDKNSPSATKDTGGRLDTPGKRWGLTMQASSDGFAPENTSIWVSDAGTGLDTL